MGDTSSIIDNGYTYFAFISHKSEDIGVAKRLRRSLQMYRLPAATHKRYPKLQRRCSPVFLDSSDLTPGFLDKGLREEVSSSKFLIIICSAHAHAESRYLDDELRYFLESGGTPDRVIPFIVDKCDAPEKECFPQGLIDLCEDQTIVGPNIFDDGWHSAVLKVVARMHGIKRVELENDDRRRRNHLFLAIGLSVTLVSIAFGLYNSYMNEQISQNYEQALHNQSVYLASEAWGMLDQGDRLGAIELALAALPTDQNDTREPVTQAEYVLQQATNAYVPTTTSSIAAHNTYGAVRSFLSQSKIAQMTTSDDGTYLATRDESELVQVFQISSGNRVFESQTKDETLCDIGLVGKTLVISSSTAITAYDLTSNKEMWHFELDEKTGTSEDVIVTCSLGDDTIGIVGPAGAISLNVSTGKLLSTIATSASVPCTLTDGSGGTTKTPIASSSNGRIVVAHYTSEYMAKETYTKLFEVEIYDFTSGRSWILPETYENVLQVHALEDGSTLVTHSIDDYGGSYAKGNKRMYGPNNQVDACFDKTGKKRWEQNVSVRHFDLGTNIIQTVQQGDNSKETPVLCVAHANKCLTIECDTGKTVSTLELPSPIVSIMLTNGSVGGMTSIGDPWEPESSVLAVLEDGSRALFDPGRDSAQVEYSYVQGSTYALWTKQGELIQSQDRVLLYADTDADDSYMHLPTDTIKQKSFLAIPGGWMLWGQDFGTGTMHVNRADPQTLKKSTFDNEWTWSAEIVAPKTSYRWQLLGATKDESSVVFGCTDFAETNGAIVYLAIVDASTGDYSTYKTEQTTDHDGFIVGVNALTCNECIVSQSIDKKNELVVCNLNEHSSRYVSADTEADEIELSGISPDGSYAAINVKKDGKLSFAIVNLKSSTCIVVAKDHPRAFGWEKDRLWVVQTGAVRCFNCASGEEVNRISIGGSDALGFCERNNQLLVVQYNGIQLQLVAYDMVSKLCLSRTTLDDSQNYTGSSASIVDAANGTDKIIELSNSYTFIVRGDDLSVAAIIPACHGYEAGSDTFITMTANTSLAYWFCLFNRYSTEDLIARGKASLGASTIGETRLAQYGISHNGSSQ